MSVAFDLDNLEKIKSLDKQDMLGVEEKFYTQLIESKQIAQNTEIKSASFNNKSGIAFLGMGGSGFTGDIIKSLLENHIDIPVVVIKDYNLPNFINKNWLIFAVSYSGNTEETLSCVSQSLERGCQVVTVCSGGKLFEIAKDENLTHIHIPAGLQPRGAVGYLFFSTFLVMKKMNIIKIDDSEIEEALELVKQKSKIYNRTVLTEKNPAKKLALDMYGRLPVVYGVSGYLSTIAYRWKSQINENAKCPCFYAEFPELNHNEIVGWQNLNDVIQKFVLIVFKDSSFSEKIKTRISTTVNLIQDCFDEVINVEIEGNSLLAKTLSTIFLGGIASVYLALLYKTDPTPVERISALKAELAKLDKES